ncbi:DUF3427 domain-containing protein [Phascolarctobacterium sp.]|uniref:DUF3427 domain-containing protein n=1 Tax=Phascolarctobacterium sp. TaxID=2049039 RepID=UPI00386F5C9F
MNSSELALYLEAGFIDFNIGTDERFLPKILTNNQQKQVKVLESLLVEMESCDDFFFSVAFVTNSGIACLIDTLQELQNRNIKGKILASQYQNFTEPRALRRLLQFPNLELKIITSDYNFHAKGYLFHSLATQNTEENYTMIIGSSNLTQSALTINREWNVRLSSMKDGALIKQMQAELEKAWDDATPVTEEWINVYEKIYHEAKTQRNKAETQILNLYKINPNKMQTAALQGIAQLRAEGKDRALLISATGTGKTFLSAFDVRTVNPKRCLFVVHRGLIARNSLASFKHVIGSKKSFGLYSGAKKETNADYLFATVQTLCKDENLHSFAPDEFDYIIVDEVHHAGAETYRKILDYFKPKFLLGMTATPERTDGYDIFKAFNYNIAYEIRLNEALAENMLVPFHYHGVSEIVLEGEVLSDHSDFNKLVCEERVKHILKYADFYGCDQGRVKGLVFCSQIDEAKKLCNAFNEHGKKSAWISGETSEVDRKKLIECLETDDKNNNDALDYLFSVDVLNEGVDIPSVNQIIMLRPTESAIVFVQQLGRGLRKNKDKRYLEVIDFIGNYENNYLLPIALYGDRSYSREHVRRNMHNNFLPGASTVHIDDIAKERIFKKLDTVNLKSMKTLKEAYSLVKFKLGRAPMMMDFVNLGDRDPYLFVEAKKSYYEFKQCVDYEQSTLTKEHLQILQFISLEIANGKRLEEIILLERLIQSKVIKKSDFFAYMHNNLQLDTSEATLKGVENVLSLDFFKDADKVKYGNQALIVSTDDTIALSSYFKNLLGNSEFMLYLKDTLAYGKHRFLEDFDKSKFYHGFKLYGSYTRKDACRILNWPKDESSTVYGYRVKYGTCPMFVTYNKSEGINQSIQYEDAFINNAHFHWWTRNRVDIESKEVYAIQNPETLKLLFIKKSDDNGSEFYCMGAVTYQKCVGNTIMSKGKKLSIVEVFYAMDVPVETKIYKYFVG